MEEFTKKHKITISNEYADRNPHMRGFEANHYKSTLKHAGRQFTLYFSKGIYLKGDPTPAEILECLQSDFNCIAYGLDDFIADMGYDRPEAVRVFNTIEKQSQKLYKLLGHEVFQEFEKVEA